MTTFQSKPQLMDWCGVVGPRGLCRPLDEKKGFPTNTSPLAPCQGCSRPHTGLDLGRAGQGRTGGQGRAGRAGQGRAGKGEGGAGRTGPGGTGARARPSGPGGGHRPLWGYPPDPLKKHKRRQQGTVTAGPNREALPSLTVLTGRSARGSVGASSAHAAALSAV